MPDSEPAVLLIAGSPSDLDLVLQTQEVLDRLEIHSEIRVQSAHRTPEVAEAVTRILETRADIDRVLSHAKKDEDAGHEDDEEDDPYEDLRTAAGDLKKSLAGMEKRLRKPPDTKGIIAADNALSRIRTLYFLMSSSWDAPTTSQMDQMGTFDRDSCLQTGSCGKVISARREHFTRTSPPGSPTTYELISWWD